LLGVQLANNEPQRKVLAGSVFEYICSHVAVIAQCPRLLQAMKQKLVELYIVDEWEAAKGYYVRLFADDIELG
jgi:hypothetical protein